MTRTVRRGAAAVWAMIVLSVLGVLTVAAAGQFTSARRTVEARERRVQALWLARSGVELAVARIGEGVESSDGETLSPTPGGEIRVKWVKTDDGYKIESEGRYNPAGGPTTLTVQRVTRTVKLPVR
jgi:type II secretory pathway component PulK